MSILNNAIKGWLNAGLGLVLPEVCQLCCTARATPAQGYVCEGCRAKVQLLSGRSARDVVGLTKGILPLRLNVRTAARWNCTSSQHGLR